MKRSETPPRRPRRAAETEARQQALQAQLQLDFEQRQQARAPVTAEELAALVRARRREMGLASPQKPVRRTACRQAAARRSRGNDATARRRLALRAQRRLPYRLATDERFTDAFFVVLDLHLREADTAGGLRMSLAEITNRLKMSRSTVIRAHTLLESEGLIVVTRRRLCPDVNAINTYQLGDELMRGRVAKEPLARPEGIPEKSGSGGSVIGDTPKEESIEPLSTANEKSQPFSQQSGNGFHPEPSSPTNSVCTKNKSIPPSREAGVEGLVPPLSDDELTLVQHINTLLDPRQPKQAGVDTLIRRAEALLAEEVPLLYGKLWDMGLRRHGFRALAAVFETVLFTREAYVHTPHGYLWGILRKPRGAIAPDLSLRRFLMQRKLPRGLKLKCEGSALPGVAWQCRVTTREGGSEIALQCDSGRDSDSDRVRPAGSPDKQGG